GSVSASARLARDGVAEFYRTYYRPNGAWLLIVGDVTLAEARRLAAARFGGWERGDVPAFPSPPPPARAAARTVYLIDKPGAAQSVVRIGHAGPARTTPDWFALEVLNTIVGGAFTSRLNQNLRETHGYTYGAFSQFAPRRLNGAFVALASVVTAKTDSSLVEFLKELRRIRDEAVAPPELAKAKAYLTLGLPGDFETTGGAAARFRELLAFGLPLDYYDHYVDRINAITGADVQRDGNGGGGGVAVLLDVHVDLVVAQADGFLHHLENPQVRLVRDEERHVRRREAVRLQRGGHRLRHQDRGELEDLAAFHYRAVLPLLYQLRADERVVRQAGGVDPQFLGVAAVGVEVGREHAAPRGVGRAEDRDAGAITEQHGRVATARGPVEPAGMHFGAHQQHAGVLAGPDPRVGHRQPVHESGALVAHVDR